MIHGRLGDGRWELRKGSREGLGRKEVVSGFGGKWREEGDDDSNILCVRMHALPFVHAFPPRHAPRHAQPLSLPRTSIVFPVYSSDHKLRANADHKPPNPELTHGFCVVYVSVYVCVYVYVCTMYTCALCTRVYYVYVHTGYCAGCRWEQ